MHLRSGRILGFEVAPKDSTLNVDLEAILGPSIKSLRERSSLNNTSFVLGSYFDYDSSTDDTLSMESNPQNPNDTQVSIAPDSGTQSPT